jgi:hypothetical protein
MTRSLVTLLVAASALGGCGSSPSSPSVPTAQGAATAASGGSSRSAVAAAVHCIRAHGIPGYQDPVITPGGAVYTDMRSFESAPESTRQDVQRSCRAQLAAARLDPMREPPAPPALVQAGVKVAQCQRAHGMPNVKDPNASSSYTPGHGFGLSVEEVPAGGKSSPVFTQMRQACIAEIDAEMKASTLASLGGHG